MIQIKLIRPPGRLTTACTAVKAGVQSAAGTIAATARTLSNTLPVRRIAVAQVPYLVWVAIATVLQLSITAWNW